MLEESNMDDDKSINITSILESCMSELKRDNKQAYNLIIDRSKEGYFENHQTTGNLKKLAKEILENSNPKEQKDES